MILVLVLASLALDWILHDWSLCMRVLRRMCEENFIERGRFQMEQTLCHLFWKHHTCRGCTAGMLNDEKIADDFIMTTQMPLIGRSSYDT